MRDTTGGDHQRYRHDQAQIEEISWQSAALREKYLQGNFWPACGLIGGVLLFIAAAVIVPP
jgi:hypothetical protein